MQICTKMHDFSCKISKFPGGHTVLPDTCGGRDTYKGKHRQAPIPQTQVIPDRSPYVEHKSAPMVRSSQNQSFHHSSVAVLFPCCKFAPGSPVNMQREPIESNGDCMVSHSWTLLKICRDMPRAMSSYLPRDAYA